MNVAAQRDEDGRRGRTGSWRSNVFPEPTDLEHAAEVIRRNVGDRLRHDHTVNDLLQRQQPGWVAVRGNGRKGPRYVTIIGARNTRDAASNHVGYTSQQVQKWLTDAGITFRVRAMSTAPRLLERKSVQERTGVQVFVACVRIDIE
jgi:hypothetical protein